MYNLLDFFLQVYALVIVSVCCLLSYLMESFHKVGIYPRNPFILLTALTILFGLVDFTQIYVQYVVFFRVQAWVTTIVCYLHFYMMGFFHEGGNYT